MEERRANGSWVERLERLLGLYPPGRSPRFWLVLACVWAVALPVAVWFFAASAGYVYGWNQAVFLVGITAQVVISVGEALFAGAFAGRFAERGRALRVVGSVGLALAFFTFGASSGYRMGSAVGAILGGLVVFALYLVPALFYRRSSGRGRPMENRVG